MNVYTLLELPKSSRGFSSISQSNGPRSGAQLRKVARTDTDLDSASASRSSTGVTSGSRRIQISGEDFRPNVLPDPFYSIRHNISVILTPFKQPSLIESYEAVSLRARYIVCVDGKGEGLYNLLKKELEVCMKDKVLESLMKNGEWISFMGRMCDWFHGAVGLLQSLLSPLDQAYVPTVKGTRSINALAYDIFNDRIFGHAGVSKQLRENLSTWIAADRQNSSGERASRSSVAHLLRHFIAHDVYFGSSQYEQYLLTSTEEYYVALVATLNHDMYDDPSAFFEIAYDLIEAEVERAEEVFPPQSRQSIKETTIRALFILPKVAGADNFNDNWLDRLKWLATPETVKAYVTSNRVPTMGKMYHLLSTLSSVSGSRAPLKVLSNAWKVYIHNIVSDIVKVTSTGSAAPDLEEKMVPNLLKFREQAEGIIDVAFISKETNKRDGDFSQALSDGFISGFKTRRVKPAEMLAKYLDGMMRKGQAKFFESLSKSNSADGDAIAGATQNAQDTLFHSHLLQVLGLYRFSEDKDVFRTFYHRQLTKRLLLGRSASSDAEVAMLRMLKEQYDSEFDMGETMFKDLALSTELMNEFRNHRLVNGMSDDNLDVRVLQRSAWPFDVSKKQILIPDGMEQQLSNFATFYHKKHGNRTLDWDHALGTMSLKTRFRSPGKDVVEKELSVSLYQGIILLMFQEKNKISFLEIREVQHSIDDDDLRRTLQSLACGKKKLLLKEPPGRDVNDGDMFLFNDKFVLSEEGKKAGYKIHVNSIQAKVSVKESATTNRHIQEDRKHLLDAAIVRIMKAKKQLEYEQLKSQTIEAVKRHFAPEVEEIKSRVEALVEQEYLERAERVPGQKPMFKYVA